MANRHAEQVPYPSPQEWRALRAHVLERAKNACEQCRAPTGHIVARGCGSDAGTYMLDDGSVVDDVTGEALGRARGSEYEVGRFVTITLSVVQIDVTRGVAGGLRALCHQCHARLGIYVRAQKAAQTRARARDEASGQGALFPGAK